MKKYFKIITSILLTIFMLTSLMNVNIYANDTEEYNLPVVTQVNPLYQDIISEDDIPVPEETLSPQSTTSQSVTYQSDENVVAQQIRNYMKQRKTSYTLYVKTSEDDLTTEDGLETYCNSVLFKAINHTGNGTEGDYLAWVYGGYGASSKYINSNKYKIVMSMTYYTTSFQESLVTTKANEIINSLNLNNLNSEYDKVKAIYNYLTSTVTYDNTVSENLEYTAYGALYLKRAVCQGISAAFYRLCLMSGVDARIIAGYGGSNISDGAFKTASNKYVVNLNHAWNIVRIGTNYYCLDATWGIDDTGNYFLEDFDTFTDTHYPCAGYALKNYDSSTSTVTYDPYNARYDFHTVLANYNLSTSSLSYTTNPCSSCAHSLSPITKRATLYEPGYQYTRCIYCGQYENDYNITKFSKVSSVKLSATSYVYNGSVKNPSVTIKDANGNTLTNGTDYTITKASGRKNVGTYKYTIKGINRYSFTKTLSFTIKPKSTSITSLTKLSGGFNVKYKKISTQCSGYQIMYSKYSSFSNAKTKNVTSYKTTSKKITGLSRYKKYYVKVRTYKTVNNTKYYSAWSKVKTVTTK